MVYRDLPRVVLPPQLFLFDRDPVHDRGYALEEGWSRRAHFDHGDRMLSEWRDGLTDVRRPAVIFNSTISETGEPITFSTTTWQESLDPRISNGSVTGGRAFYKMYVGDDVRVATAVRLAASFPYVTPAARPATTKKHDYHLIDGGYYDNYGVTSLVAWLQNGLAEVLRNCEAASANHGTQNCGATLPPILVIQIRSFPPDKEAQPTKKGWAFQAYAPIEGLLSVRSTGQLVRDQEALELFARAWDPANFATLQPKIRFATFEFGGFKPHGEEVNSSKILPGMTVSYGTVRDKASSPPLSWAMNKSQLQAVRQDWNARLNQDATKEDDNIKAVHAFFDRYFASQSAGKQMQGAAR